MLMVIHIRDIFKRLKLLKNIETDIDLARFLGVKRSTLSMWIVRNKVPCELLVTICGTEKINLHWLLTGQGEEFIKFSEEVTETEVSSEVLEALRSHPIIEQIVLMLGNMKEEDVLYAKTLLELTEIKISSEVLEALRSHPTIEQIVLMLKNMKEEDISHVKTLLEDKNIIIKDLELRIRNLEHAVSELQKRVEKSHNEQQSLPHQQIPPKNGKKT
jgi:hypothetical protein